MKVYLLLCLETIYSTNEELSNAAPGVFLGILKECHTDPFYNIRYGSTETKGNRIVKLAEMFIKFHEENVDFCSQLAATFILKIVDVIKSTNMKRLQSKEIM